MSDKSYSNSDSNSNIDSDEEMLLADILPANSKDSYMSAYRLYQNWRDVHKLKGNSEENLLKYFNGQKEQYKPSTLLNIFSKLKSTLLQYENTNIEEYQQLKKLLKTTSSGYKSKAGRSLTHKEIETFIDTASDKTYLAAKAIVIVGISGGCKRSELCNIEMRDVEIKTNLALIKINESKNYHPRKFIISEAFFETFKNYYEARSLVKNVDDFFLNYANGRCTKDAMNIASIGKIPRTIASYLKLPQSASYTAHHYKRLCTSSLNDSVINPELQTNVNVNVVKNDPKHEIEIVKQMEKNIAKQQDFDIPNIILNNCSNITFNFTD